MIVEPMTDAELDGLRSKIFAYNRKERSRLRLFGQNVIRILARLDAERTRADAAEAEPSAPVAPDWPTRCAALEADGISARKRIATLEAENAALRERNENLVEGLRFYADPTAWSVDGTFLRSDPTNRRCEGGVRARALLQGGPDAG